MVDELTQIKHTEECLAYIWQTLNIVVVFVVVEPFESLLLCYSVAQSSTTLCYPTDCITPGSLVFPYLLWFVQTHVL